MTKIIVGAGRDEASDPMQVASGPHGRQRVHYAAPAADRLDDEMARFLEWFNGDAPLDPMVKAAIAKWATLTKTSPIWPCATSAILWNVAFS